MAASWRLKNYLAQKHNIYSATSLQKIIVKKTGTIISIQNLCNYLNSMPKLLRVETMEVVCTALNCNLNDFCEITPSKKKKKDKKKLSYKNTPLSTSKLPHFYPLGSNVLKVLT